MGLRFRDLVAETIVEHEAVITESGEVWWGWWAKQAESVPFDTFRILAARTEAGPIEIFLLDSGHNQAYMAELLELKWDQLGGPIPCPDTSRTPRYYSARDYKAWFRISRIWSVAKDRLRSFSYDEEPGGLLEDATAPRFHDKRVHSIEEALNRRHRTIYFLQPFDSATHSDHLVELLPEAGRSNISNNVISSRRVVAQQEPQSDPNLQKNLRYHFWTRIFGSIGLGTTVAISLALDSDATDGRGVLQVLLALALGSLIGSIAWSQARHLRIKDVSVNLLPNAPGAPLDWSWNDPQPSSFPIGATLWDFVTLGLAVSATGGLDSVFTPLFVIALVISDVTHNGKHAWPVFFVFMASLAAAVIFADLDEPRCWVTNAGTGPPCSDTAFGTVDVRIRLGFGLAIFIGGALFGSGVLRAYISRLRGNDGS